MLNPFKRRRRKLLSLSIENRGYTNVKVCLREDMTAIERIVVAEVLTQLARDIDPREATVTMRAGLCAN